MAATRHVPGPRRQQTVMAPRSRPQSRWRPVCRVVALLVSSLAAMVTVVATPMTAAAAPAADHLDRGYAMYKGQSFTHNSGVLRWTLIMQNDGNLVQYLTQVPTGRQRVCFASNTYGRGWLAVYQSDGNFVVYDYSYRAVWASNTVGVSGSTVDINYNGQLWVGNRAITGNCSSF